MNNTILVHVRKRDKKRENYFRYGRVPQCMGDWTFSELIKAKRIKFSFGRSMSEKEIEFVENKWKHKL